MGSADLAGTREIREVPHTHNDLLFPGCSLENQVKELRLTVLHIAPERIGADICQLDHAGQLAIHEERGLYDPLEVGPQGAPFVERFHQLSVLLRHGLVIIVDQQTVFAGRGGLQELLKPGDNLVECLFIHGIEISGRIEVNFVDTLGKEPDKLPV